MKIEDFAGHLVDCACIEYGQEHLPCTCGLEKALEDLAKDWTDLILLIRVAEAADKWLGWHSGKNWDAVREALNEWKNSQ